VAKLKVKRSKNRNLSKKVSLEELEELNRVVSRLTQAHLVVVEGERDEQALRALGVKCEILRASGVKRVELVNAISKRRKRVVLLLDHDREGLKIKNALLPLLESEGVKVEYELGDLLFKVLGGRVKCVEEVKRFSKALALFKLA